MHFLQFLCLLFVVDGVLSSCDPNFGPAGGTECVAFPSYYNQYQWATCLTNAYIQQKSNQRHICKNRLATYCYYQCMIETHNKESGIVTKDCSCLPSSSRSTLSPSVDPWPTTLPPECHSPSGASCQWYRNCLEKKYPCEATTNAYAIQYAEKFCTLYEKKKASFSEKGQKWINAVRKCLQVALVPLIRPYASASCQEIRQKAFDSHTPCYLRPDKGAPSVCDLECFDFIKIFFTIKESFLHLDTAGETLKGMWNILGKCGLKCSYNWFKSTDVVKLTKIVYQKLTSRKRRSSDDHIPEEDKKSRFADQVVSYVANKLKWDQEVMGWFSYSDNSSTTLYVVMADRKVLGLVQTAKPSIDLNKAIDGLANAIRNSSLPVQVDGSNVWLKSLDSCSDKDCSNPKTLAVSDKPPAFPSGGNTMMLDASIVGASCLAQLLILWFN